MKPHEPYTNGDDGSESDSGGSGSGEGFLCVREEGWAARALGALNALRKSRQHYDVVLVAGGAEVAAHRAVLAAASPRLLRELGAAPEPALRLDVAAGPLRALVEHAYTGRLRARDAAEARALYRAAAELRMDAARTLLGEALLRRVEPQNVLALRELPDLEPERLAALDAYIADHFDEICECGALATLPEIRIEMMRDSGAVGGESPRAIADAALSWLLDAGGDVEELGSRAHLVYVDARGALRDCGELPAVRGDAPELQQYRREAQARGPPTPPAPPAAGRVLGARRAAGGGARALLLLRGRAAGARLAWTAVAAGGGGVARGAALGGGAAALARGRAALGAVALGGRLLACGGYDRARVLRCTEIYDPATNAWAAAADMAGPRARFAVARLRDEVWAVGGSDGQGELDTLEAYKEGAGWTVRARLPGGGVSHAGAAADEAGGELYVVGGWAGGGVVRRALAYSPASGAWRAVEALGTARAQAAAVWWRGSLWAVGGCDAWRCLASVERLGPAGWEAGPALPTARRATGAVAWRGRLVAAGGSDGAASLRRTDWLEEEDGAWRPGPALRRARAAPGLAALGEALYAVGGFDGAEFLSCVEVLASPEAEWTRLAADPAPQSPRLPDRAEGEREGADRKREELEQENGERKKLEPDEPEPR